MPRLTPFQRQILERAERKGAVYVRGGRTARALGTNNPNLSRSTRLLQERGLLGRYPCELTDAGRAALEADRG